MKTLVILGFVFGTIPSINAQSKIKLDLPLYVTSSLNFVPQDFKDEDFSSKGGLSYDVGIGLKIQASPYFSIKGGVHWWNKVFSPRFPAQFQLQDGSLISGRVRENGQIKCTGLYLQALYEGRIGYAGGGLDIAMGQSYKADISAYSSTGQLLQTSKESESILVDEFKNQIDLVLLGAVRVPVSQRVTVYPSLQIAIPLQPVFDSGVETFDLTTGETTSADFQIAMLKFGFMMEWDAFRTSQTTPE
jgi:hypothetical protein